MFVIVKSRVVNLQIKLYEIKSDLYIIIFESILNSIKN